MTWETIKPEIFYNAYIREDNISYCEIYKKLDINLPVQLAYSILYESFCTKGTN